MSVTGDDGSPVVDPAALFARLGLGDLDGAILIQALVHSSYAHERSAAGETIQHNGRLEFLGDAVVDLAVSHHLHRAYPQLDEGQLTRLRAAAVAAPALARRAGELGIGESMFLSRGEAAGGGRSRESVLSEALEALVAATFLAAGWERAEEFVRAALDLELLPWDRLCCDPKSTLQELTQARGLGVPCYDVVARSGPDHDPCFTVQVSVAGQPVATGSGGSKKAAENVAASAALRRWQPSR